MKLYLSRLLGLVLTGSLMTTGVALEPAKKDNPEQRRVSLAYVTDIHAQLEPHPELFWHDGKEEYVRDVGGLSRIATVFKELRAQRPGEMLFIDGGDTIQGSGPAAWTDGKVVVEPMNSLGLDLAVPGNWSVVYGAEAWKERASEFNYQVIAANMTDESGQALFEPYVIKEVNGVRLGIIGFTEPDIPVRQPPFMSEGLTFQHAEVLQPLVEKIRNEEDADVVVIVSHIGLPRAVGLADKLEGVDIILSADSHERTYEPIIRGDTWVVEAGAFGSFVGLLDVMVDAQDKVTSRSWRLIELRPEHFPEDPEVKQVVDNALAPHRERMNQVVGYTNTWLSRYRVLNTSIDNIVAEAIRTATGADIGLSNGYRFSPPTAPGAITEADLWTWLPIDLQLKAGVASGEQLQKYWEKELENVFSADPDRLFGGWLPRIAGLTVHFRRQAGADQRVEKLLVDDQPLDLKKEYRIAAGHSPGAPVENIHRVAGCQLIRKMDASTHDAVRNYLQTHSPIPSEGDANVRCIDCTGVIRSQFLEEFADAETKQALSQEPASQLIKWNAALDSTLAEAKHQNKFVLVRFTADWCAPCRVMDARVWPDTAVQSALAEKYLIVKSDIDVEGNQVIARKYGVQAVPTLLVLDSNGEDIVRGGFMSSQKLIEFLQAAAKTVDESDPPGDVSS